MKVQYEQIYDGEWARWDRRDNYHQCCGCGLIHRLDFRLVGKRNLIETRWITKDKETKRLRKRMGITVKKRLPKKR